FSLSLAHRPPPTSPLFPYTTLFRSLLSSILARQDGRNARADALIRTPLRQRRVPHAGSWRRLLAALGRTGLPVSLAGDLGGQPRSEEHTSELQSRGHLVCRLLLEKK